MHRQYMNVPAFYCLVISPGAVKPAVAGWERWLTNILSLLCGDTRALFSLSAVKNLILTEHSNHSPIMLNLKSVKY